MIAPFSFLNKKSLTKRFVAVGNDAVFYTPEDDHSVWVEGAGPPEGVDLKAIAYGNGIYVAIGTNISTGSGVACTSVDGGKTFNSVFAFPDNPVDICFLRNLNKFFILTGGLNNPSSTCFLGGADGLEYEQLSMPSSREWTSCTYGDVDTNPRLIAVNASGSNNVAYTTDLSSWTQESNGPAKDWWSVDFLYGLVNAQIDGIYSATTRIGANKLYGSPVSPINFIQSGYTGTTNFFKAKGKVNGFWVMINSSSTFRYESSGSTTILSPESGTWRDIAANQEYYEVANEQDAQDIKFVCVKDAGSVRLGYTTGNDPWSSASGAVNSAQLKGVCYGGF